MRNYQVSRLKIVAAVLFGLFLTVGCSSNNDPVVTPTNPTIVGIATTNQPTLTSLVAALNKFPDLVTILNSPGSYTVFAPTNTAFSTFLSGAGFANLDAVPLPLLREILLNHVVAGNYTSTPTVGATVLTSGYLKTLGKGSASATNTLSLYVNVGTTVRLNGVSNVTLANIAASNGVVHVVDAVIGLPTIVTHTAANPNFSSLLAAVTSTGAPFGNQSAVATALTTNTTPLTVFAPTNAAFTAALAPGAWANGATAAQVTRVLQYHVTSAGNVLAASLTQNQIIPMLATSPQLNTTIDLAGGAKVRDTQNLNANIIVTDVQCSNGVIHAIDRVLRRFII